MTLTEAIKLLSEGDSSLSQIPQNHLYRVEASLPTRWLVHHRYGDSIEETLRRDTQGAILIDPAYVVATMAVAMQHIGLEITRSTTYSATHLY